MCMSICLKARFVAVNMVVHTHLVLAGLFDIPSFWMGLQKNFKTLTPTSGNYPLASTFCWYTIFQGRDAAPFLLSLHCPNQTNSILYFARTGLLPKYCCACRKTARECWCSAEPTKKWKITPVITLTKSRSQPVTITLPTPFRSLNPRKLVSIANSRSYVVSYGKMHNLKNDIP